jgi:hypothetical protein
MKASTVILIAVLAVILALIIYAVATDAAWAQKGYWLANFVESPWQVYRRSDGTFDEAAQLALRRATGRHNPTPADHFLSATVLTRNVLAQEHRPELGRDGRPTPAAQERARIRRDAFDQARTHYMAALEGLRTVRGGRGRAPNTQGANPDQIIDAAVEFAFGGVAGLLAHDPLLAALVGEDWDFQAHFALFQGPQGVIFVDQPLAMAAGQRREELVRERQRVAREAAKEQGGARGAGVDTYFELATQHTDDPQNAHDQGVLACLRAVIIRLREEQPSLAALPAVDDVVADLRANGDKYSDGRRYIVADAVAVAERTRAGERVITLDATDEECLRRVWARADDPRNAATKPQMRQALFDALVDAWEPGISGRNITCVNGRTTRILSALVLTDFDKRNWTVKKLEQFKNDIYEEAGKVIAVVATRAAESSEASMAAAGRSYLAKTAAELQAIGEIPADAADRLAESMRAEIGQMVDDYIVALENELGAKGAIPEQMVETVKAEAQAAVI